MNELPARIIDAHGGMLTVSIDISDAKFRLEHDPEKWIPVFRKDHAPPIN
jgi:hypothetical protein